MPPKPSLISRISAAPGVPLVEEETSGPSLSSTVASSQSKRRRPVSAGSENVPDSEKGGDDGGTSPEEWENQLIDQLESSPPVPEDARLSLADLKVQEFDEVEDQYLVYGRKEVSLYCWTAGPRLRFS